MALMQWACMHLCMYTLNKKNAKSFLRTTIVTVIQGTSFMMLLELVSWSPGGQYRTCQYSDVAHMELLAREMR